MDEQRVIEICAPVTMELLADAEIVGKLIERMLTEARRQILIAADGRACRIERVRFVAGNDETTWLNPGHGVGLLRVTYTPDAPPD